MMGKSLQPHETLLRGEWIFKDGKVRADEVCRRIEWLIRGRLKKIADSPKFGAWLMLYVDPGDGRLWERSYPEGEMHGGGPPQLEVVPVELAAEKYEIAIQKLRRRMRFRRTLIGYIRATLRGS